MSYLTGSKTPQALKANELIGRHNTEITSIRANRNLTHEGKVKQIAAAHLNYKQQITKLEAEDKQISAAKADSLRRTLFGLFGNNDPNALISYRDAQDRVAAIDTEQKAMELLDRSDLSNDEILAKAIVGKAAETGWHNVVSTYTRKHPYYGEKLKDLAALSSADQSIEGVLNHALSYTLNAPTEVARHSNASLQQLAAEA